MDIVILFIPVFLSLVSIYAIFLFLQCTEHLEQKQFICDLFIYVF